jgi:tRNA(Ile)-lysidine synthetase-like protein
MPLADFPEHFARLYPHWLGRRVLVALSGGSDSVALIHLLGDQALALDLEAAHVHHSIRGAEADRDAAFCDRLCAELEIPFHLLRIEPEAKASDGREAGWRRQRYQALLSLARRRSIPVVATAHHRDDVAEGVLMQLLRGAGTRALAGIAAETRDGVIRPLLAARREEILAWLRARNIEWCEDSSNQDMGHLRNRVRHMALPELRSSSPKIDSHLVNLAASLAADEGYFASELDGLDQWIDPWDAAGGVPRAVLLALPRPLRSRWLHAQAARAAIGRVSRRMVALFHRLVEEGSPRSVGLAARWRLYLARGQIWLEPPQPPKPYAHELIEGHAVDLSIPGWRIELRRATSPDPQTTWHRFATADSRLSVRSPRPGDVVLDNEVPHKVSSLLAKKAPRHLRPAWPLFCENDRITWIPGVWTRTVTGNLLVEVSTHERPPRGSFSRRDSAATP